MIQFNFGFESNSMIGDDDEFKIGVKICVIFSNKLNSPRALMNMNGMHN